MGFGCSFSFHPFGRDASACCCERTFMKSLIAFLFGSALLTTSAVGQSVRLESILPASTDPSINGWLGAHAAAFSNETDQRGQLMVYLHGQGGTGTGASELLRTAARAGYHAVGLTYPNDWSPFILCSGSNDPSCSENLRREIIDGTDRSSLIAVSRANSIENRLIKLLAHLEAMHLGEGWGSYVDTTTGTIRWNLIAVWGHSQGGGNAGVLARHQSLARVCLSAPAADGGPGAPGQWWASHATPSAAYFGFCHTQDSLNTKIAFWTALGMAPFGSVVDIASAVPPYANTHMLSTSVAPAIAGQFHNSVVADSVTPRSPDGSAVYIPVWSYMLTAPIDTTSSQAPSLDDQIFATVPTFSGQTQLMLDVHGALTGVGPRPVLVWIHGGGWQSGSHNQVLSYALNLRSQGITVVSIGYRLTDQAVFPAQIHDCKGAIRWLRANAASLQIDPNRIGVWGSSAGGHLAALVATSGDNPALEGNTGGNLNFSSTVLAAAAFYPPTDILQMQPDCNVQTPPCSTNHDLNTSPESKLLNVSGPGQGLAWLRANASNPLPPFPELAALAASANPITHVTPNDPPLLLAHGDLDTVVPLHQSIRLRDAALAQGIQVSLTVANGFGHGSVGADISNQAAAWMRDALLGDPSCDTIDFNADGLFPDDADLVDFLSVLAGGSCSTGNTCNDIDFNNDGLFPDDNDLVAFLRVLAGGSC
jgi:acetyl esterase/lipase